MTRDEYRRRFAAALERAAADASRQLGRPVSPPALIELPSKHFPDLLDLDAATDALFLGEDRSYLIIDVGVMVGGSNAGVGWVRRSGHRPMGYDIVWDAEGIGPFRSIGGFGTDAEWREAGRELPRDP